MTNEVRDLFEAGAAWLERGKLVVLATVVYVEGSSYRRPGVRMLLSNTGDVLGAVSGGCIEKDVQTQAQSVFETGQACIMSYDGRFRLGCEGIIYLLLEPFAPSPGLAQAFRTALAQRRPMRIEAHYSLLLGHQPAIGSLLICEGKRFLLRQGFSPSVEAGTSLFSQSLPPIFQLYLFGAEHDAVHLCSAASLLGWEVTIVASPKEGKSLAYFPGAKQLLAPIDPALLDTAAIDAQTAVVLMSHSFHRDIQHLLALQETRPAYLGLLGAKHRRERIVAQLMEQAPDISLAFLELLHGPAGLNIGAESPAEIAVSILSEILSTIRQQEPMALKDKAGSIHD